MIVCAEVYRVTVAAEYKSSAESEPEMNPRKKGHKKIPSPETGWLGSPEIEEPEGLYRVIIKWFWMDYYFVWLGISYCISHLIIKWPFAIFFPPGQDKERCSLVFLYLRGTD